MVKHVWFGYDDDDLTKVSGSILIICIHAYYPYYKNQGHHIQEHNIKSRDKCYYKRK